MAVSFKEKEYMNPQTEKEAVSDGYVVMPTKATHYYTAESFEYISELKTQKVLTSASRLDAGLAGANIDRTSIKRDLNTGNPDIIPSKTTLGKLNKSSAFGESFFEQKKTASASKGKLFFAIYALMVLTLVCIIIYNAVSVERQVRSRTGQPGTQSEITAVVNADTDGLSV